LTVDAALLGALHAGAGIGLLGTAPVEEQVVHARRFGPLIPQGARVADLGSGAGLPGLVVAYDREDLCVVLVERSQRRADHLRRQVSALGLGERVQVIEAAAEALGRDPAHRGVYGVVTARSFGPPAVVGECAVGLLGPAGVLLVSEPPGDAGARWAPAASSPLGLVVQAVYEYPEATIAKITTTGPCPEHLPRRAGIPSRRPLF